MKQDPLEMHSDDCKTLPEMSRKKRAVKSKTPAQILALENFYNEHKYPTEAMKTQLAESIRLTEKQVSGWFCHRRLKDKKSNAIGKPARQDHGIGHKQDSCGSTKQGDCDLKEFSATDLTHEQGSHYHENHMNDQSSGSSSSLRNASSHQNGDRSHVVAKFMPTVVKRLGPSGYLKVKGRVENPAITAVKRQLGEHYQEQGPALGVQFDPLPPGAFEPSAEDTVKETCYIGEAVLSASDDSKTYWNPKLSNAYECKSSPASYSHNINGTNYKRRPVSDILDSYLHQRFRPRTSLPDHEPYYHPRQNSLEQSEDDYIMKLRPGVEAARINSVQSHPRMQLYNMKIKNGYLNPSIKRKEFCDSAERGQDGKMYTDRRSIINENRVKIHTGDSSAPKRLKEQFPQPSTTHLGIRSLPTSQMPSSFSEDEDIAETSSSGD